jgi:hypothetical protein
MVYSLSYIYLFFNLLFIYSLDNTVTLIKSLEQFNNLSQTKLNELNKKFETNTLLIHDLKFELEGIFKRIK